MILSTEIYVHKTSEIFIWYIRLAVATNISPGNASCAFFMGPHLALGTLNPFFPRYTLWVSVHANQTKCFPTIFVWAVCLNFPHYFLLLRISCRVIKKALPAPRLMCFSFCHLSRFLLVLQGCFHWRISQNCCTSFLSSSVCCSFPACSFRKRTDKFRSQGHAWGRICFCRCSFG